MIATVFFYLIKIIGGTSYSVNPNDYGIIRSMILCNKLEFEYTAEKTIFLSLHGFIQDFKNYGVCDLALLLYFDSKKNNERAVSEMKRANNSKNKEGKMTEGLTFLSGVERKENMQVLKFDLLDDDYIKKLESYLSQNKIISLYLGFFLKSGDYKILKIFFEQKNDTTYGKVRTIEVH